MLPSAERSGNTAISVSRGGSLLHQLGPAARQGFRGGHNSEEEFWQGTFQEYSFVFSQVFSFPVVVLKGKACVGGKGIRASGGKEADYLLQNVISRHALIVELKTPATPLLLASP